MIDDPRDLDTHQLESVLLGGVRSMGPSHQARVAQTMPRYAATPDFRQAALGKLLGCANELLRRQSVEALRANANLMESPRQVKDHLVRHFCGLPHEAFVVMFLNGQHGLIACEEMFRGTLTQTSVYPREIVRRALQVNAGAVLLAHNHPSGRPEPSRADEYLTQTLKTALALVDVRVLDHIVVGGTDVVSFAERGLL